MSGRSAAHGLQGLLGLLGTIALMVSVVTCEWYRHRGLWDTEATEQQKGANHTTTILPNSRVRGAQRFFAGLSFIMAAAGSCVCLVYLFCLGPPHHPRRMPKPGSLLLAVLPPTGFFFSVAWTLFTWQHRELIMANWSGLGYSYWLGGFAWTALLLFLPVLYLINECAVLEMNKSFRV